MQMRQRLVRSIVIGLVVSLVAGGVAMASAPKQEDPTKVPDTFAFASPRDGERGAYDAVLHGSWGDDAPAAPGQAFRLLNYTRAPGGHIRDQDGRDVDTDVLRLEGPKHIEDADVAFAFGQYAVDDVATWIHRAVDVRLRAGTRDLVAIDEPRHDVITLGDSLSPLAGAMTRTAELNRTERTFGAGRSGLCALDMAWQGQVLPTVGLKLEEECSLAGIVHIPAGTTLHAVGWKDVRGVRSLQFTMDVPDDGNQAAVDGAQASSYAGSPYYYQTLDPVSLLSLDIYVAPTVSVPIAMQWSDSRDRSGQIFLVGYDAGTGLPQLPASYGPAFGPVRTTTMRPWGLDDTGANHPFPLSVAFQAARDDLRYRDLGSFLQAHPDAVTWRAQMEDVRSDAEHSIRWTFSVTDGSSNLAVEANRTWRTAAGQTTPPTDDFSTASGGYAYLFTQDIPQGTWPVRVPTVTSLWERWNMVAGSGAGTPNSWGFTIVDDGQGGTQVLSQVGRLEEEHGNELATDPANPGLAQTGHLSASILSSQDGRVVRFEQTEQVDASATTLKGTTRAPAPHTVNAPPTVTLGSLVPSGKQAAGAGLLGLVVAVLYYLWPSAKAGGFVGLFSRLSKPEVLEHPQRVRILQAIEGNPGIHFQELLRSTELANGALVHHVRKLEQAGAVVARKTSGYTCYFVKGIDRRDMDGAETARAPGAKALLEVVRSQPGLTSQEAATLTGLAPSTVAYHAQRLAQAGLVSPLREGRVVRLHPGRAGTFAAGAGDASGVAGAAA